MSDRDPKQAILAAAARLFYRDGIHATGIDAILAEAGCARQSLYTHFRSKDGLVAAFLEARDESWRTWFRDAVERSSPDPRERLLSVFDALASWFRQPDFHGCAFINAAVECGDPRHAVRRQAARHKELVTAYLRELAEKADAREPERLARHLALLVEGAIVTALVCPDRPAAAEGREIAAQLIAQSVFAPASVSKKPRKGKAR